MAEYIKKAEIDDLIKQGFSGEQVVSMIYAGAISVEEMVSIDGIKSDIERALKEPQYQHEGEDWKVGLIMAEDIIRDRVDESKNNPILNWIMPKQDDGMSDPIEYQVRCPKCGFDIDPQVFYEEFQKFGAANYCSKCGHRLGIHTGYAPDASKMR